MENNLTCICPECDNEMKIYTDDKGDIRINGGTFNNVFAMQVICNECETLQTLPLDAVVTIYSWVNIDSAEEMQHIALIHANETKELINAQVYQCPKCDNSVYVFIYVDKEDDGYNDINVTGQITTLEGYLEDNEVYCNNCDKHVVSIK